MQPNKLKKKHIESFIQDVPDFEALEKDKWHLEQHITPPFIAAEALHQIYQRENLAESRVCDLGCGTGMLSCGLIFAGAEFLMALEYDSKYISMAQSVLSEKFGEEADYEFLNADVTLWNTSRLRGFFDVVVMNPPFGTKEQGIDYQFLLKAFDVGNGNVYSFHKSSTREFLKKKAKENGKKFELIENFKYPITKRYAKYHKHDSLDILVDFVCFSPEI